MAFFSDPDGNALMLHHRYAPPGRPEDLASGRCTLTLPAAGLARAARDTRARAAPARRPVRRLLRLARARGQPASTRRTASRWTRTRWRSRRAASCARAHGSLPFGETGRRDYRLAIPVIDDAESRAPPPPAYNRRSSRSPRAPRGAAVRRALERARPRRAVRALIGPERPVALIANLATHHLWGSRPSVTRLLAYLLDGEEDGPPPDWEVGHFVVVVGRVEGPRGNLYAIADTYPALGDGGVHLQPRERLAAALERREMPAGGMLVVVASRTPRACARPPPGAGLREAYLGQRQVGGSAVSRGRARRARLLRPRRDRARTLGGGRASSPPTSPAAWAGCRPTTRSRRSARSRNPTPSAPPATCG